MIDSHGESLARAIWKQYRGGTHRRLWLVGGYKRLWRSGSWHTHSFRQFGTSQVALKNTWAFFSHDNPEPCYRKARLKCHRIMKIEDQTPSPKYKRSSRV